MKSFTAESIRREVALVEQIADISREDCEEEGRDFLAIAARRGEAVREWDALVAESGGDDKVVAQAKHHAKDAAGRLAKGMQYGGDMASSAMLCYQDAIANLQKAIDVLEKAGVRI